MEFGILFDVGSFRYYVIWSCIFIGSIDLLIMFIKSMGPYKYSEYRQSRLDDMKEWLEDYNNGIFPVIGDPEETWSYTVVK